MARQPESSYWFPSELLSWDAKTDEDLRFNVSTVPLSERAAREHLQTVNATQNKETNIMAISIMNSSTSGNSPHGLNKVNANTFTYWQYVDTLVYWGGSSGEGLIVSPSPDVVDAAHKNGVRVLGTVFMPQVSLFPCRIVGISIGTAGGCLSVTDDCVVFDVCCQTCGCMFAVNALPK